MDFLEATKGVFRATRLVYWSAKNKVNIVRAYKQAAAEGSLEEHRWGDLLVRTRWCALYLGDQIGVNVTDNLSTLIHRCIVYTSGEDLPDISPLRIRTPISFTAEPCAMCKSLELSFHPDDRALRNTNLDWKIRYSSIMQALVADSFKIMGAGYYYQNEIEKIRHTLTGNTPQGYAYSTVLQMWDIGMNWSRRFLDSGKNCFSNTERTSYIRFNNIQPSRHNDVDIQKDHKYSSTVSGTLKAQGGLFALNTELLCEKCKPNVEPDPVEVEL